MKESKLTVSIVALVCLAMLSRLFVFTVQVDEMAVRYDFNTPVKVIIPEADLVGGQAAGEARPVMGGIQVEREAGWYWKWPYPFSTVKKYDHRIRTLDAGGTQQQLPDENNIIPRLFATWQIVDPVAFERSLQSQVEVAEHRLKQIIGNESSEVFGRHRLSEMVNTDPQDLQFDEIERQILGGVRESLRSADQPYGIKVETLGLAWVTLPEDATKAVFARMRTERKNIAEKLRAEGEREKRTLIAEAQEERDTIIAKAQAEAKRIRAQGEAEAAQYYDTFAKNENLSILLRRLEALRTIAASAKEGEKPITFIFSTKTAPFDTFEKNLSVEPDLEEIAPAVREAPGIVEEPVGASSDSAEDTPEAGE